MCAFMWMYVQVCGCGWVDVCSYVLVGGRICVCVCVFPGE